MTKKMVWAIDDDDEMRNALKLMLKLLGYDCRDFGDPREFTRALLGGEPPDLVFLDINMPLVTGVEVLQFIRSRDQWKKIPVLMVSSESEEEWVEQTLRMGADSYVFKPVNMDELRMAINTAIQKREAILND